MGIRHIQRTSLINYPGKICSVVFFDGCNLRCHFCYNKDLQVEQPEKNMSEEESLEKLRKYRKYVDAVCLTGGDPVLYYNLTNFIKSLKSMGYFVKLDWSGESGSDTISFLIGNKLIDMLSLDMKMFNILDNYCKPAISIPSITSLNYFCAVDVEYRTTLCEELYNYDNFYTLLCNITNSKMSERTTFYLQNYVGTEFTPMTEKRKEDISNIVKEFRSINFKGWR